jgi:hypothetical protein
MTMTDIDIDLGDPYDKPTFDISWLDKPNRYDINLDVVDIVHSFTADDIEVSVFNHIIEAIKKFLNK